MRRPFSDSSLPDLSVQVIPECSNAAESQNNHLDEQEASPRVPALALPKMPLPSPPRRVSVTSEALSHNSRLGAPVVGGQKGPVRESLTSEQVASLEGTEQQPFTTSTMQAFLTGDKQVVFETVRSMLASLMPSPPIEWLQFVIARKQCFRHEVNMMASDLRLQLHVLVWLQV